MTSAYEITEYRYDARPPRHTDRSMIFNTDLVEPLELDHMLAQAIVSLRCATGRMESRGAPMRERSFRSGTTCTGSRTRSAGSPTRPRAIEEDASICDLIWFQGLISLTMNCPTTPANIGSYPNCKDRIRWF